MKDKKKRPVRDKPVMIAFTKDEYGLVLKHAGKDKASLKKDGSPNLSKFCRNILLADLEISSPDRLADQLDRFNYEIRKIGININQAVKKLNQGIGKQTDIELLKQKMDQLLELHERLIRVLDEERR